MRNLLIFIAFLLSPVVFSQGKAYSYYFDRVMTFNDQYYTTGFKGKVVWLTNSQDSTYSLTLRTSSKLRTAQLYDRTKKVLINFDLDFVYAGISDLNKLKNPVVQHGIQPSSHKKYKHYVMDVESVYDTLKKQLVIHSISYKNKYRKKMINEHYFFYAPNDSLDLDNCAQNKKYYAEKHNIFLKPEDRLVKVLCLDGGKMLQNSQFTSFKPTDFTFKFNATP